MTPQIKTLGSGFRFTSYAGSAFGEYDVFPGSHIETGQRAAFFLNGDVASVSLVVEPSFSFSAVAVQGLKLFAGGSSQSIKVKIFQASTPLPAPVSLLSEASFGDSDSRLDIISTLPNGVLVVWHQHTITTSKGPMIVGAAFLPTASSSWQIFPPMALEGDGGNLTSPSVAGCLHPVTKEYWVFWKRDSFQSIDVVKFTPTGTSVIPALYPRLISKIKNGKLGPESERPFLLALDNTTTIRLAYQCEDYVIWSTNPFIKGAKVAIAEITSPTDMRISQFPNYLERLAPFALIGDDPTMIYRPIDGNTNTSQQPFDLFYCSRSGTIWETSQKLTSAYRGINQTRRSRAYYNENTSTIGQISVPVSPPPLPPVLVVTASMSKPEYKFGEPVQATAIVKDQNNNLVDGATVEFTVVSPKSRVATLVSVSSVAGVAKVDFNFSRSFGFGSYQVNARGSKDAYQPGEGQTSFQMVK